MASGATPTGLLRVTSQGRGVVVLDETIGEQVWVEPADLGGAIDGDLVAVELTQGGRRPAGRIVRVVKRGRRRVTGTLDGSRVLPDDPRLGALTIEVVEPDRFASAVGQVVLAEVAQYPAGKGEPLLVSVARVVGEPGVLPTEVSRVLFEQGVVEPFSAPVESEARAVPDHVRPGDRVDRVDLRDRPFITIDPETARDFDDAATVERRPDGSTRVWIAVADVSHYVRPATGLDEQAEERACSIYLPDRSIPMLPPELSSGICSLVPHKDRLALVVRLDVDERGRVTDSESMAAVIHSRGQLDYQGVAAAFAGKLRGRLTHYREHLDQLYALRDVARKLRQRRLKRGSLDLDLPESKVVLDEDDPLRVRDIRSSRADPAVREAYNLVEELMLAANEAVARYLERREVMALWRVHEAPLPDALIQLAEGLASYGIQADPDKLAKPKAMARLLKELAGHPAGRPLSYLVLRSLKQAKYETVNKGHFGLASQCYLHFTSPIRRYPDLVVHRLVKRELRAEGHPSGGRKTGHYEPTVERLIEMAEHASARERVALDVSRQVHSVYAAALMRDRVGDENAGTITGLAPFGIFVGLHDPAVDGLVRIESLPEAARFDAARQRIFGRRSGRSISLGDAVEVKVVGANVLRRQVDFELLQHEPRYGPAEDTRRRDRGAKERSGRQKGRRPKRQGGGKRRGR